MDSLAGSLEIFFFRLCLSSEGVPGAAAAAATTAALGVLAAASLAGGAWPFLTGVLGGKVLSMYPGEM